MNNKMNNKKFTLNELLLDLETHMQIYLEALRKISLSEGSKTTMKRIANQALSTAPSIETAKEAFLDNIKTPYEHDRKRLVQLKKFWDAINEYGSSESGNKITNKVKQGVQE